MLEVAHKYFVNNDNRSLVLGRVHTYREGIMFRVHNHTDYDMTPIIGLSSDFVTVETHLTGVTIVPSAFCDVSLPAIDANDNMFNELYIFLDYQDVEEEVLGLGLEFDIMQDTEFSILYFVDEGVENAFTS